MKLLLLILTFFLLNGNLWALRIDKIETYFTDQGNILLSLTIKDFPTQEVILALKEQKSKISFLCEIEFYRKRLLKDELLDKFVYYQEAAYFPEKNKYYLENNFKKEFFNSPEEILPKLVDLTSIPLGKFSHSLWEKNLYFKVNLHLKFSTHLKEDLRFSFKRKEMKYRTSLRYDF